MQQILLTDTSENKFLEEHMMSSLL